MKNTVNGVINSMLENQRVGGKLSKNIECEANDNLQKVTQKLKEILSTNMVEDIGNYITELMFLYEERAYEVGVKDGIKLAKELEI